MPKDNKVHSAILQANTYLGYTEHNPPANTMPSLISPTLGLRFFLLLNKESTLVHLHSIVL